MSRDDEQKGMDLLRKSYFDEVRDWAEDYDKRIAEGEWDDRGDFIEAMDQEIDGAARVIYTFQARVGLLCSNNEDAYFEEFGDDGGIVSRDGIAWEKLMYFAFRADILERMQSDIDDDATFDDEEDDEEDEDD